MTEIRLGEIMGEFFKGWRRKFGLLTLVMALVFMCGWIRSQTIGDFIQFDHTKNDDTWDWIYSTRQRLVWQRTYDDPDYTRKMGRFKMGSHKISNLSNQDHQQNSMNYVYRKRFFGFELGGFSPYGALTQPYSQIVAVPYWSITIPLTAISLWLLLSKPKTSTSKKSLNPRQTRERESCVNTFLDGDGR